MTELIDPNQESQYAWNANAEVWDARMGDDGNDFFNLLVWPKFDRFLVQYVVSSNLVEDLCFHYLPQPQLYFERPLQYYLNMGFENGFVLDGFVERAFPPEHRDPRPLSWGGQFSEIPPALVARMRLIA
jgi:hypothetical protein